MSLKSLTMSQLRELHGAAQSALDSAKKELNGLNAELELRVKPLVNSFGTVEREVDGVLLKVKNQKKVEWDQGLLEKKYQVMIEHNVDPTIYIKKDTVFKISETAYKNWSEDIQESFADARTELSGNLTVEFVEG